MADPVTNPVSTPDPSKIISMGDFARLIKDRIPTLKDVPDEAVVSRALTAKPELGKQFIIGEPSRPIDSTRMGGDQSDPTRTRLGRTPTADQRSQKFFENHPVVREIGLGAFSGLGIPESNHPVWDMLKGLKNTVTDAPKTTDEKAAASAGLGVPGLAAYRIAKSLVQQTYGFGQEAFDSINWEQTIKNAKGGKLQPYEFKEGSGGAPQFAHGVAGLATMIVSAISGGKKVPEAGEAAVRAGEKFKQVAKEGPTVTAQRMAGTGPALAKDVAQSAITEHQTLAAKHAAEAEKISSGNAAADVDYKTTVDRLNEDYDAKIADAKERHAADVGARERIVTELESQHADKVAAARQKWVQQAYEAKQVAKEQAKIAGRKEALQSAQKSYAGMIIDNVKKTHDIVKGKLDTRWNQLRDAVGKDAPVETVHKDSGIPDEGTEDITEKVAKRPSSIVESIEESRAMLAGVPEDLKIFNDLMKTINEKGGEVVKEFIPFDDARTQYSAIGDKAFGADGNMRRALFNVYDAYDRALGKTAEAAGQGKTYAALKKDWGQFRKDWDDMSSAATGGSPLARLYRAVDKPVAAAHVLGKFGDRLFGTFARYKLDGAAPDLMAKLRNYSREYQSLPKSARSTPTVTPRASLPAETKQPAPVAPVEPKLADIEAERAKKLQRKAEDKPDPKAIPEGPGKPPNFDDIVAKTKEAKREAAAEAKESSLTPGRHDAILAGLSAMGVVGLHNIAYAIPYTVARLGEAILVSSETGQRWLSKVTPADIKAINEVLAKDPSKTAGVQKAVTDGLIAKAKKGEKLPPLSTLQGLLTRAQLGSILRMVAPPQQQNNRPQSTAAPSSVQ